MSGPTPHLQVAVGGDARSAAPLGAITIEDTPAVVVRLLDVIAAHGRTARAADVLRQEGTAPFRSPVADELKAAPVLAARETIEAIGQWRLRDGRIALGVALAFGHADAAAVAQLAHSARDDGTRSLRAAPGRVLLFNGLDQSGAAALATAAERLGFIVRADDPRRRIAACPGKPACASGWIAARALAAEVARQLPRRIQGIDIHISGCAKGCAHPASAALAVVGTEHGCGIVRHGSARTTPQRYVEPRNLVAEITHLVDADEAAHG
jgi:precorrin-3B synthase